MPKIRIKSSHIVITAVFLVIFLPGYIKLLQLKAKNICLEREIARLERENIQLYKEKNRLQEDIDYVEKVARQSMGVTRKGEIPIRIQGREKH